MGGSPTFKRLSEFSDYSRNMEGYCVKCRKKVPMVSPTTKVNSRGVGMWQAKCATCGKTVNTFKSKAPPPPVG